MNNGALSVEKCQKILAIRFKKSNRQKGFLGVIMLFCFCIFFIMMSYVRGHLKLFWLFFENSIRNNNVTNLNISCLRDFSLCLYFALFPSPDFRTNFDQ